MSPSRQAQAQLLVQSGTPPASRRTLQAALARLARLAARASGRSVRLSFVLLGDADMRRVNREHLRHDRTTDVLAFALEDQPRRLVGEVLLGVGVARREAAARDLPPYHELLLYAVHGTLHLLGHDDHAVRARAAMRAAERDWLAALGVGDVYGRKRRRAP